MNAIVHPGRGRHDVKITHLARALAELVKDADRCVPWPGALTLDGYGQHRWTIGRNMQSQHAHRTVYELIVGPIPEGLELDHLCKVRACINPKHLEPVTRLVNNRRRGAADEFRCANGHERNEANMHTDPVTGWQKCRPCDAAKQRRYRAAAKAST
jgi:hypothetical protein